MSREKVSDFLLKRLSEYGNRRVARREKIEKAVPKWREVLEGRAMADANPINPQRVFWELPSRLPDNCILSGDAGSSANWFARDLEFRRAMKASMRQFAHDFIQKV